MKNPQHGDFFIYLKYYLGLLVVLVLFFAVAFMGAGARFARYDEKTLLVALAFFSAGVVVSLLGVSVLNARPPSGEKRYAIIYMVGAVGLMILLWGYLKLFQAVGLDTVRSLVLFADALSLGFVLAVVRLVPKVPADKRSILWGGVALTILFAGLAGWSHFYGGVETVTPWLKGQLVTILLFAFAIQSQPDPLEETPKTSPEKRRGGKRRR